MKHFKFLAHSGSFWVIMGRYGDGGQKMDETSDWSLWNPQKIAEEIWLANNQWTVTSWEFELSFTYNHAFFFLECVWISCLCVLLYCRLFYIIFIIYNIQIIPECIFMTDQVDETSPYHTPLQEESRMHGDVKFQNLRGGIQFGIRYLNHVVFSFLNYDFDYMMRLDDDYFFCMGRFLHELPVPMVPRFHWGWTHCLHRIVRPEESVLLFSRDLLKYFLIQDENRMKCHPWADQMIGAWTDDLKMTKLFRHDSRLHHEPIVAKAPELRRQTEICHRYMGVHGCYPEDMKLLWEHRGDFSNMTSQLGDLISNSKVCEDTSGFQWELFIDVWKYEPKPCIVNHQWDTIKQTTLGGAYTGRGEDHLGKPVAGWKRCIISSWSSGVWNKVVLGFLFSIFLHNL